MLIAVANYLGDFLAGATVQIPFTTEDGSGGRVEPNSAFEVADVRIYKDGSDTQRSSQAGYAMTSPFDTLVGVQYLTIDLSDNTDADFYTVGSDYVVVLYPDETVATQNVSRVIGLFSIQNRTSAVNVVTATGGNKRAASSYVLTTGTQSANTIASVEELDSTRHEHTDDTAEMDLYYQFLIGSGMPDVVIVKGYLQGANDDLEVYGYDWVAPGWRQIGTMPGKGAATNDIFVFDLLVDMVGSGTDEGKVRVRFTDGAFTLSSATLAIDQILVEYSQSAEGYEDSAVWLNTNKSNTNTIRGVDGTASNPVSTIAAVNILLAKTNLSRVRVASQSSVVFAVTQANQEFIGKHWTLALGGVSISGSYIEGAAISGTGTGASEISLVHCHIGDVTLPPCDSQQCVLKGTFTIGTAGQFFFEDCKSGVAGISTPKLDFGAALDSSNVGFRNYSGGIKLANMGAGAGSYNMSLEGNGQLILGVTCSPNGTIAIRGNFPLTDNVAGGFEAGGGVISQKSRYDIDQITKRRALRGRP